ncbi:ATP-binding protein [Embleya sp. NBC_00888]|uniref:ATP-binding protein n=1 Tax=Embleya sp. NBC_00888 TaxID=2975960 RepID=UPI00386D9717|nr:ATP-binding protein [Embleya sp. NBC_00888]
MSGFTNVLSDHPRAPASLDVPQPRHGAVALTADASQVRIARRFVATLVTGWGIEAELVDSVVLVVGELAANAAEHGGSYMYVSAVLAGAELCVNVTDLGPRAMSAVPAAGEERGRGLGIVDCLADWFDVTHRPQAHTACVGFHVPGAGSRQVPCEQFTAT